MPKVLKLVATTFNLRRGDLSPEVKIVVIGQASVGKTAMILQYISGKFIEDYTPQCATLYEHSVQMDNANVGIHIWDTAGQFEMETNVHQLEVFIRWADVVLMTYAVTDPASFMLATHLLNEIQKLRPLCYRYINGHRPNTSGNSNSTNNICNNSSTGSIGHESSKTLPKKCCDSCQDLPVVVVATKVDLIEKRRISEENGISLSHSTGCVSYRELSVKNTQDDSKGVRGIFEEAVRRGWLYRQHCVLSRNKYLSLSQHISRNRNVQIQVPKTFPPTPIIIKSTDSFVDQSNETSDEKNGEKKTEEKEENCKNEVGKEMKFPTSTPKHGKKLLRRKSLADWLRKLKLKSPEESGKNNDRHEESEEDEPDVNPVLKNKRRRASIGNFLVSK